MASTIDATKAEPEESVEQQVYDAMSRLIARYAVVELRIVHPGDSIMSGYYDDMRDFATDVAQWGFQAQGIYWTVNAGNRELLGHAKNRLRKNVQADETTKDSDIARRLFIPVVIDTIRPDNMCPTHEERLEAFALQGQVVDYVLSLGFPEPFEMDSGTGTYVLIPVDFPNGVASTRWITDILEMLAGRLNTTKAKVDTGTINASQVLNVPYTVNRNSSEGPERPHRMVSLLHWPANQNRVFVPLLGVTPGNEPIIRKVAHSASTRHAELSVDFNG